MKARVPADGMIPRATCDGPSYRLTPALPDILCRHVRMSARPTAPRRADLSPRAFVAALIGIIVLTACVHARAFANPFLFFDDPQNVLDNASIRALTLDNLKIYFTTPLLGMYSPLVYLSYAFDYRIGGLDAPVYHVTNLAV